MPNINRLFNGRNVSIKFVEDYGSIIHEAKKKTATNGEGLEIPIPKQMLQRLPIGIAQIKATNNLESL